LQLRHFEGINIGRKEERGGSCQVSTQLRSSDLSLKSRIKLALLVTWSCLLRSSLSTLFRTCPVLLTISAGIMNSAHCRNWQAFASTSRQSCFSTSTSTCARSLPKPRPVRPASQKNTSIPVNVHELTQRYPKHPLLAFFNTQSQKVKTSPGSDEELEVTVPVSLRSSDLGRDAGSRGWLAPELRTKSSLELHQLWYRCLMERNKIHTTMDELQRVGATTLAKQGNYNGGHIDRRVSAENTFRGMSACHLRKDSIFFIPDSKDNGKNKVCLERTETCSS
jgi:large subunit ribosomal protein L47